MSIALMYEPETSLGYAPSLGQDMNPFQVVALVIRDPNGQEARVQLDTPLDIPAPFIQDGQLLRGTGLGGAELGQADGFLKFFNTILTTAGGAFAAKQAADAAGEAAEAQLRAAQANLEASRLRTQAEQERAREAVATQLIPGVPNFLTFLGGAGVVTGLGFLIFG